jgi:CHAT domain-containing protein
MKMPGELAQGLFQYFMLQQPNARAFEHPLWWAAFYLTGV